LLPVKLSFGELLP